jgi:molecular chaperone HscB
VNPSPFDVLGLAPTFALEAQALEQKLFEASLQWHPDRFALAPEAERLDAEDRMAAINQAHDQLVDPLNRAEVLLNAVRQLSSADGNGNELDQNDPASSSAARNADPAFLMAMMELREEVEVALQTGATSDEALQMQQKLKQQETQVLQEFGELWLQSAPIEKLQRPYEHARYLRSSRMQLEQAMHSNP